MQTDKELQPNHRSKIALALMLALLIALVGGAVVRAWPLAANALAQEATSDQIAESVVLAQVTIPPTIPAPTDLTMNLKVGPNPFCPGYRLHYDLTVTNTTGVTLDDLVVTASLPAEVYHPVDGGSTVTGIHDPSEMAMVWEHGSVSPGAVIRSYVIVNSYSSVGAGRVISTTFVITSPNLSAEGEITGSAVADPGSCPPPTATPTMTPSPTPEPTPTTAPPDPTPTTVPPDPTPDPTVPAPTPEPWMFLPLVTNEWTP